MVVTSEFVNSLARGRIPESEKPQGRSSPGEVLPKAELDH
jgi:hypothetical protein